MTASDHISHKKSHTGRSFDNFTGLDEIADITAKENAFTELSNRKILRRKAFHNIKSKHRKSSTYSTE